MQVKKIIGVMGAAEADELTQELAYAVGQAIAQHGFHLLCGGRSGVMLHSARGAREAGGLTIGVLPSRGPKYNAANEFIDIPIYTGINDARNYVNVCTSNGIIALSGRAGTLSEIALALKVCTPVATLGAWAGLEKLLPHEKLNHFTEIQEAMAWLKGKIDAQESKESKNC